MVNDSIKQQVEKWFIELRDSICNKVIEIESQFSDNKFIRTNWDRQGGGGGTISLLKGKIFEKAGVNISTVFGEFNEKFANQIPGTENSREFWACGVSVVMHMMSPFVPALHMNTRFIATEKSWFGGGIDLNPIYYDEELTKNFHKKLKDMCNKHNPDYYNKFKEECDNYFYIAHRNEHRGVGGIFYDYLNNNDFNNDFTFNQDVGKTFIEIVEMVAEKNRITKKWTEEEREYQSYKRGRYAEFNLIYDRGIKFGLNTNGNIEAMMMSMPPVVKW